MERYKRKFEEGKLTFNFKNNILEVFKGVTLEGDIGVGFQINKRDIVILDKNDIDILVHSLKMLRF